MRRFLESLFAPSRHDARAIDKINALRTEYRGLSDAQLRAVATQATELLKVVAVTAAVASRVLGQEMFDVQLRGTLALARGSIAEMQTGEGKTLAAVPAVAWYAREGLGVHVMTVNDYLARRDAAWMGDIYRFLGLSVGHLQQGMTIAERQAAYASDITYSTSNEIGFDFLRDRLAMRVDEQVQRSFAAAVIDEVDSLLIDEARIPLVIAGGDSDDGGLVYVANRAVQGLRHGLHFTVDGGARNVALTDHGIATVERATHCGNLYAPGNIDLLSAVQDALHAHVLLRCDVDYVVKNGAVEMVDAFKGRIALDRRWPAGLHTAVEVKEGVATKRQGMILGTTTLQHLISLYPKVCGMTGTAATQKQEFAKIYGMEVETIPTHRPIIRIDKPDVVFASQYDKERAVLNEIQKTRATGQPVLVGTGSVEESERLSAMLPDVPHQVLNARNDELEAGIVARAGERGAVTISTNMAGRGTDIRLGEGVAALGGLYVIGTQKHESRRIDNQLRGRAGRQGDPGTSRFLLSEQDGLFAKYRELNPDLGTDIESVQRLVEGQNLDQRVFLQKYELAVEGQRYRIHEFRQQVLEGKTEYVTDLEKRVALRTIDDLWADYLVRIADFRSGLPWLSWGLAGVPMLSLDRRDAYYEFAQKIRQWFPELEANIPVEIARRIEQAQVMGIEPKERGAVWTYLTTDEPFGSISDRLRTGLRRLLKR